MTHKPTGLIWKKCSEGLTGATCTGTPTTYTWAQAVALTSTFAGYSDWRLPTADELVSLVDYTTSPVAINTTLFPTTPTSYFWSGSSYVASPTYAWGVSFGDGSSNASVKTYYNYVRLVRGGQSFRALAPPGAPTSVSAIAGNANATVSFIAPINSGGASITGYTVTSSPGGVTATGTASPIVVTGLSNGTVYTFTVTASNSVGTGVASVASNSVTPIAPRAPDAPTSIIATAGYAQATVSFAAPAYNGGDTITSYTVTASPGGYTVTGSASPITVIGLANGTSYTFTVTASNSVGTGVASVASNSVIPAPTAPGAPTNVIATAGNTFAAVSYSPPLSNGGSVIMFYTVTVYPGGKTVTSNTNPINVTGLINGTAYTFTVAATNAIGTSSASSPSILVTPSKLGQTTGTTMAVAKYRSVALKANGQVIEWGNIYPDCPWLPPNTPDFSSAMLNPVTVQGLTDVVAVAVDEYNIVALKSNGTVMFWGWLNDGFCGSNQLAPVPGLTGVIALAAGGGYTVALKSDGTVMAWSMDSPSLNPVAVSGLDGVISVAVGSSGYGNGIFYSNAFALKSDGTVMAWGNNSSTPVLVQGLTDVVAVAAGSYHTVALKSDGTVMAWGVNTYGQLGDGTTINRSRPVSVLGLSKVVSVSVGRADHTLAIDLGGTVWGWGWNGFGQLGDGAFSEYLTPSLVVNEKVDGFLDLMPDVPNEIIPAEKIPPFWAHVKTINTDIITTITYNSEDLNKSGNVYVVAYLDPASPLLAGTALPAGMKHASTITRAGTTLVAAVQTRSGWKQAAAGVATAPLLTGTLTTSNNTVSMYNTGMFNHTKDTGIFCVAYAGASTTSAKGLIRPVVMGLNVSTTDCSAIQIASVPNIQVPGSPLNVVATAGNGQASVSFDTPASDGGSPITGYTVTASPGGNVGKALSPPIVISGLTNGTAYTFSVSATNSAGDSAPAATLNSVTPMGSQLINFSAPLAKTFGDAPITLSASGGASGNPVTFTVISGPGSVSGTNNATLSITGVGNIVVKASQAGNSTSSAANDVQQTIVISPKALTITANNASRAYGAANPATPGFTTSTLVGNDVISVVTYSYAAGATSSAPVGTNYSITPSAAVFSSGNASNYTINYVAGTLSITGAASFTVSATAGANGSIAPASQLVASGNSASLTVTPNSGYTAVVSGCGGTLNGGIYTTAAIVADCPVSATFTVIPNANQWSLIPGWNLLGNSVEAVLDITTTFNDNNKVITVWKWIAANGKWAFYTPSMNSTDLANYATGKGYGVLGLVNGGEGFWVNAKATFTVPMPTGTAAQSASFAPATVSPVTSGGAHALPHGWSLIATGDDPTPSSFDASIATIISLPPSAGSSKVYENLTTLWAWDAVHSNWYFWAPSLVNSGGLLDYIANKNYLDFSAMPNGALSPATGFWVNMPP